MTETLLVVAAHPDDEILGLAGTIARHGDAGDNVHILIVAEGATSRQGDEHQDPAQRLALQQAASKAAHVLGARQPRFLGLADNRLDAYDLLNVIQPIEAVIDELRPSRVYTHHGGDLNRDHRIVHEAVVTACRPLPGSPVRTLLAFETVSSTEWASPAIGTPFKPDRFHDIAAQWDRKAAAISAYNAEMRPFPHARSLEAVEALATLRGSQAGMEKAEAFVTILDLWS